MAQGFSQVRLIYLFFLVLARVEIAAKTFFFFGGLCAFWADFSSLPVPETQQNVIGMLSKVSERCYFWLQCLVTDPE